MARLIGGQSAGQGCGSARVFRGYPDTPRAAFLEWCQVHAPIFTAHAEDIGLTEVQANAFAAANTAAHGLVTTQETAPTAAKMATEAAGDGVDTLRTAAADTLRSIRAFAETQAWSFVGVSGKKEFVDDTRIAGPDSVQYTVQGQRADSSGAAARRRASAAR